MLMPEANSSFSMSEISDCALVMLLSRLMVTVPLLPLDPVRLRSKLALVRLPACPVVAEPP